MLPLRVLARDRRTPGQDGRASSEEKSPPLRLAVPRLHRNGAQDTERTPALFAAKGRAAPPLRAISPAATRPDPGLSPSGIPDTRNDREPAAAQYPSPN